MGVGCPQDPSKFFLQAATPEEEGHHQGMRKTDFRAVAKKNGHFVSERFFSRASNRFSNSTASQQLTRLHFEVLLLLLREDDRWRDLLRFDWIKSKGSLYWVWVNTKITTMSQCQRSTAQFTTIRRALPYYCWHLIKRIKPTMTVHLKPPKRRNRR